MAMCRVWCMYHARTNGNVVTVAQAQNGDVVYMKWGFGECGNMVTQNNMEKL